MCRRFHPRYGDPPLHVIPGGEASRAWLFTVLPFVALLERSHFFRFFSQAFFLPFFIPQNRSAENPFFFLMFAFDDVVAYDS